MEWDKTVVIHLDSIAKLVLSPDHAPLAVQGNSPLAAHENGLATIEAFLVSDDVVLIMFTRKVT